jgi:poly(hydroxyalkanoate) granule-associated protein
MAESRMTFDFKRIQGDLFSSTRNVWLASLGVLATVEEEGQSLFGTLVEKGKKIEARGKKSWTETRKELESTTEEIGGRLDELGGKLDHNISEVLQRMGVPSRTQVEELTDRVEKLTGQVERLTSPVKKAPARRPTTKAKAA